MPTPASIETTSFDCPHCGVFTSHTWFNLHADAAGRNKVPGFPDDDTLDVLKARHREGKFDEEQLESLTKWVNGMQTQKPFFTPRNAAAADYEFHNVFASECYVCEDFAIWVHDRLIYPGTQAGPLGAVDLPQDARPDYDEARRVLDASPRSASALLRLCIQKICVALGEKGKNIDEDIASLVSKGLNPIVQQSLDIVRVVGNESVHPGTMDLKDDRKTAETLFSLVNSIVDQMISHPKHVSALYAQLPAGKREAIEKRNAKALENKKA